MPRWLAVLAAICCSGGSLAQEPLTSETILLARVRNVMTQNLLRLPNYTCLETVERSRRGGANRRFQLVDTLRLEVAMVDGKELYSWPGARKFEDRPLTDMVSRGGAIGTGTFGVLARAVFLSGAPTFQYVRDEERDGRKLARFDFKVPLMLSGYSIRVWGKGEDVVPYHGTFWADRDTMDVIRLQVQGDDLPPVLELSAAGDSITYSRVKIGERDMLLPQVAELSLVDIHGQESRNRIELSGCRQYTGESTLLFEEVTLKTTEDVKPVNLRVPQGLRISGRLNTEIREGKAAIGDPVSMTSESNAKRNGEVIVPKGAVLAGRITRLEKRESRRQRQYYVVGMEFTSLHFDNVQADIQAIVEDVSLMLASSGRIAAESPLMDRAEPSTFMVSQNSLYLPRGMRMTVRTQAGADEEKK